MAKLPVYNQEGKASAEMDANDVVFGATVKQSVIHQVYRALLANAREPWANAKDKSEVRGGGKKPWKQKGTGRARHGSIRSPIWRGGGATFGPLAARNYVQKINRKMNRAAVRMALSGKATAKQLAVVEAIPEDGKTSSLAKLRKVLPGAGKSTLLLVAEPTDALTRAVVNLDRVHMQRAMDVNVADIMNHQYLIATKDAIATLETRLA